MSDENQSDHGFPRIYAMDKDARRTARALGIFLLALFLVLTLVDLLGWVRNPPPLYANVVGISGIAIIVIGLFLRVNQRVILYENAIEVNGWLFSRKLNRQEIRGWRTGDLPKRIGGASYYILVPMNAGVRELRLPPFLQVDKHFQNWIDTLSNVDG